MEIKKVIISPSILTANWTKIDSIIDEIEEAGCQYLHFDVMDGHFVPNISFGAPILKSLHENKNYHLINDVHLMIENPRKYVDDFIKAGADIITFHYEAMKNDIDVINLIDYIHSFKVKAGISIKPHTDVKKLKNILGIVDLVLIMSVEPGFGGQMFKNEALTKILYLADYRNRFKSLRYLIEVDGGINKETAKLCRIAGVDILVSGSYIVNSDNIKERILSLNE